MFAARSRSCGVRNIILRLARPTIIGLSIMVVCWGTGLTCRSSLSTNLASQLCQIVDRGGHAGHRLVALGAGHPATRQLFSRRADFVGFQSLQVLPFSIECSGVRREELVRRAGQEIAVEGAHINSTMRRIMYRVDEAERTNTMSELCNLGHIVNGANGV